MANTVKMVQNDTAPDINFTIKRSGSAVDLTGATVAFKIKDTSTSSRTNDGHDSCTITNQTGGACKYVFTTGDIPNATTYNCDLEITYSNGKVETSPGFVNIVARAEV